MLRAILRVKSGHRYQRVWHGFVSGMLVCVVSSFFDLKADLIPAVENPVSATLRVMIENHGTFLDCLVSWLEFPSDNVKWWNLSDETIAEVIQAYEERFTPMFGFPLLAGWFQGDASNSIDLLSSASSAPPAYAANLTSCVSLSDSVILLYWRGRESIYFPEVPSSGVFHPPRQPLFDSAISSFGVERGILSRCFGCMAWC